MFNIMKGISTAIYKEFGRDFKIYKDEVKQGFKEPCFFITLIKSSLKKGVGNRYEYRNAFDVSYFPPCQEGYDNISTVESRLYDILENINIDGGLSRGTDMSSQTIDGVLHFMVDYDFAIRKEQIPAEFMVDLEIEGSVKGWQKKKQK